MSDMPRRDSRCSTWRHRPARRSGRPFRKLDPRAPVRNPVMFVVEVGSAADHGPVRPGPRWATARPRPGSSWPCRVWLWFTVLFANFAEAMAEGRGKAQADALRRARGATPRPSSCRAPSSGRVPDQVPATALRKGDVVLVEAGDIIPGDGEVIEGIASVDESAITGESAPVIRESGGDRSAVTGGTRVLSDWLVVRITAEPGRDLPGPHDRHGRGRQAAEDAQRDRPEHPAGGPDHHLPAGAAPRCCPSRSTACRRPGRARRSPSPCWWPCWSA